MLHDHHYAAMQLAGIGRRWHNRQLSDEPSGSKIIEWIDQNVEDRVLQRSVRLGGNQYPLAMLLARSVLLTGVAVRVADPVQLVGLMRDEEHTAPHNWVLVRAGDTTLPSPLSAPDRGWVESYLARHIEDGHGIVMQGHGLSNWWSSSFLELVSTDCVDAQDGWPV